MKKPANGVNEHYYQQAKDHWLQHPCQVAAKEHAPFSAGSL